MTDQKATASNPAEDVPVVTVEADERLDISPSPLVKITPGGGYKTASFKGKKFTREGVVLKVQDLDWSEKDWIAAHKDPRLTLEPVLQVKTEEVIDERGNLVGEKQILRMADPRFVRLPGSQRAD